MSSIYEEVVLAWDGKEYTIQPNYRMVQRIEARGISIWGVCQRLQRGDPQMSQVAEIISHMLQSGGAKRATPERVYAHLLTHADAKEGERIAVALMMAFIPVDRPSGNSVAPGEGAGPDE